MTNVSDPTSMAEVRTFIGRCDEAQGMTPRARQIYRREDGQWRIVHRHGDILSSVEANGEPGSAIVEPRLSSLMPVCFELDAGFRAVDPNDE